LLAPYVDMPLGARGVAVVWPIAQLLLPVFRTHDARSIQDPTAAAESLGYGYTTPRLLAELLKLVRSARRRLGKVHVPTLILHSREDNRVRPTQVARVAARIQHPIKSLLWMYGCGHVLTADYCKEEAATLVVNWFERCVTPERATTTAR
jgi:carboxylesterase